MLFQKIKENIKIIIKNNPKIILGLSGGADSIFLFHFFKKLHNQNKIILIAAHLDHGWRKESIQDLKFCKKLCKNENINFVSESAKNLCLNLKFNGSKEELGRNLRRFFLQNTLKQQQADYIALAHHLQDQQETFLWRIIRGSSLTGLCCMKKYDPPYLRPILNITKQEILNYLNKNKLQYIEDKTNYSDLFLRNRIRKNVIPAMQKVDSRFDLKFQSTLRHLQESEAFLHNLTQTIFDIIFTKNKKQQILYGDLKKFFNLEITLQKRIILNLLYKQKVIFNPSENYLKEILRFINNGNGGSHQICNEWKLFKKKNRFWIDKNQPEKNFDT
ncbi:tRNA lysidine(34) synthetase TilS [Candidatus Dependentiae bacterium]